MPTSPIATALVVGASRGLGLGLTRELLARNWQVTATHRQRSGLDAIAAEPSRLTIERVDIADDDFVAALRAKLSRTLDLLFVNAGIAGDRTAPIADVSAAEFAHVLLTNAYAPIRFIERFADLVAPQGMIAVMSSGLGSIADNERGGWETYRASKAALNMMLRSVAVRGGDRSFVSIAPGWVRTDMGGDEAPLDVETSMKGVVDVIEAHRGKPGSFYLNYRGETVRW